jgi:hypothetical protein
VVTDELPPTLSFVSASNGGTFSNGTVTWNLGNMPTGQVITLAYTAKSAAGIGSNRYFRDLMDTEDEWTSVTAEGDQSFVLQSDQVKSGTSAWKATSIISATRFSLETILSFTVSGNQPALRLWHNYNTQNASDAGIVEIKRISDPVWSRFPKEKVFRNPYPRRVEYSTFAIPYLNGFSGNSNGWIQSYFDLSDYAGEEVTIRFNFGTNDDGANPQTQGAWYVDEIEVMDILNYDTEACVTDNDGDKACARAPERGVIVQPGLVGIDEPGHANAFPLQVQPNPAADFLYITPGRPLEGPVQVQLLGADGRLVQSRQLESIANGQIVTLDVQQVPAGVYMVRVENAAGSSAKKIVIR